MKVLMQTPMIFESLLLGILLIFAQPASGGLWFGGLVALSGSLLRWCCLFGDRRNKEESPGLKKMAFLRHPFELGGMMILFGFGVASSAPYLLAFCFVMLSLYHKFRVRPLIREWSSDELRQFGQWQLSLPASSPGFVGFAGDCGSQKERSEAVVRSFYKPMQKRELLIVPVFLLLFWLKSILRYDFWTSF